MASNEQLPDLFGEKHEDLSKLNPIRKVLRQMEILEEERKKKTEEAKKEERKKMTEENPNLKNLRGGV
ncbi:hypothetical protein HYT01_01890 [Candidatus Giovannonibacteria bacterium]|nr:hypothetical protein [Candidatus Giovannonibacteria bacterium]